MRNLNVTLIEFSEMLGVVEADIIKKATLEHSKAIEDGKDFEQKILSLLKENEKSMIELFNQGLKRKTDSEIASGHDSNEVDFSNYQEKSHWKKRYPEYLSDMKDEMGQAIESDSIIH